MQMSAGAWGAGHDLGKLLAATVGAGKEERQPSMCVCEPLPWERRLGRGLPGLSVEATWGLLTVTVTPSLVHCAFIEDLLRIAP